MVSGKSDLWAPILQRWQNLDEVIGSEVWIVRDDLLPFPLAGNKIRKIESELSEIREPFDVVITNGGIDSNHCRTLAMFGARNRFEVHLVLHGDQLDGSTLSTSILSELGASFDLGSADSISERIQLAMNHYASKGKRVKVVSGGGHTKAGALAFKHASAQIFQERNFDHVFLASGTGATQGGIAAAAEEHSPETKVVGISVARSHERGLPPVAEAAKWAGCATPSIIFDDNYRAGGYGIADQSTLEAVNFGWSHGLPLDPVYTGKAFNGLLDYSSRGELAESVLFWHTGGLLNWIARN